MDIGKGDQPSEKINVNNLIPLYNDKDAISLD